MYLIFWLSFIGLIYSFFGYGLLLSIAGFFFPRRVPPVSQQKYRVTFLVCAHNEAAVIKEKIENIFELDADGHEVNVVVVSDGSTDGTAEIARQCQGDIKVLEAKQHIGKLQGLNWGLENCDGDIVVFSDANSLFPLATLKSMLKHFVDPMVGGVCGQIVVSKKKQGWMGKAESIYWRYDQMLKLAESRIAGAVSAQGSVYAIRKELTAPVEEGCADDFVMSVRVVEAGKRLVFEPDALTEEQVTDKVYKEFDRRVRSTEMGWRGLMQHRQLLNPFKYGFYSVQLFSHKFLRRMNPVMLVTLLVANLYLLDQGWFYQLFAVAQLLFYGLALAVIFMPRLKSLPGSNIPAFFVIGHAAMAVGIFNMLRGKKSSRWKPVRD